MTKDSTTFSESTNRPATKRSKRRIAGLPTNSIRTGIPGTVLRKSASRKSPKRIAASWTRTDAIASIDSGRALLPGLYSKRFRLAVFPGRHSFVKSSGTRERAIFPASSTESSRPRDTGSPSIASMISFSAVRAFFSGASISAARGEKGCTPSGGIRPGRTWHEISRVGPKTRPARS